MKKFCLILAISLMANFYVISFADTTLDKIENSLYGFKYNNETEIQRVNRIENTVYGKNSNGNITQRINKLKKDLSSDLLGQEITPTEDTFRDEEAVADANIQYPIVDELEKQVFKQTFIKKDIKQRLSSLEQKTFGKTYNDDLSTRVERLKAKIRPASFNNNAIAQSSNTFFDGTNPTNLPSDYHLDEYNPKTFDYDAYNKSSKSSFLPAKQTNLATIEKNVLRNTYQNDTTENRLARLEQTMFGTEFSNEETQSRIERVTSAYKAQKSADKYDDNRFSRNMATALQIGTIILMVLACIL